jgi:hypothetical protein
MRAFFETAYVVVSIVPLALLGTAIAQTEGSLVSGIAIGAMVPMLAGISLFLVMVGVGLILLARRQGRRVRHLVLGTVLSSPMALLVGGAFLFG